MFKIESIPIDKIVITHRARKDYGDIERLAEDIQANTLLYPILVNENYELLAGERRLKAVTSLGETQIECKILTNLTQEDKLIVELIDNTSRKNFTWAEEVQLKRKIHDQLTKDNPKWGYRETSKKLNCSIGGLSTDLEMATVITTFPDLAELPTKAKARDTYKKLQNRAAAIQSVENLSEGDKARLDEMLGGNGKAVGSVNGVLANGNVSKNAVHPPVGTTLPTPNGTPPPPAMEVQSSSSLPPYTYKVCHFKDMLRELPDNLVGFAELDPPYAINFNEVYGQTTKIKSTEKDWTPEKLKQNMEWLFRKLYKKLLDNSWVLCWTGKEHWQLMNAFATKAGFGVQEPGIWAKPSGSSNSPKTNMISQYEMFLLMRKGQAQFNTTSFPNVISQATVSHSQRGHQWEKPIELYDKFMAACSRKGSIFLSPFAGSGMSMVSASLHGMTPIGCDLKQKYLYRFLEVYKDRHGGKG